MGSIPKWLIALVAATALALFAVWSSDRAKKKAEVEGVEPAEVVRGEVVRAEERADLFPAGELHEDVVTHQLAIYYTPLPKTDPARVFERLHETRFAQLAVVENPKTIDDYGPPDVPFLKHFGRGMSDKQKEALQGSKQVFIVDFTHPRASRLKTLKDAHELMLALAKETHGLIWDEETREVFTPEAWKERRIDRWTGELPLMRDQMVMHFYAEGELNRLVSLGMKKLGLPDLCIENIPRSSSESMRALVNLTAQTLAERGKLDVAGELELDVRALKNEAYRVELEGSYREGATGRAKIELIAVEPQEGDPQNRLIEIRFFGEPKQNAQERQDATSALLFGIDDQITNVKHDKELLDLSAKAKRELEALAPKFRPAPPDLERLLVKAPFVTTSGGNEWMWIEVIRWEGSSIEGILQNDPFEVPGLKSGARVKVEQASLFDYIHTRADGTEVGNETGKLMMEREEDVSGEGD